MANKEQSSDKKSLLQSFKSADKSSYVALGQYIPVNKTTGKNVSSTYINQTVPVTAPEAPNFNIYEGDYSYRLKADKKLIRKQIFKSIIRVFKFLFLNIPFIDYIASQEKQIKIKETLSKIDNISKDVDKLVSHFGGKALLNDKKYQELQDELEKVSKIQSEIKKEFIDRL